MHWVKLTDNSFDMPTWVNLDKVITMTPIKSGTYLNCGGENAQFTVKETPKEILSKAGGWC